MLSVAAQRSSRILWRRAPTISGSFTRAAPFSTSYDVNDRLIVVGSGVAGSAAALIAAEVYKVPVTLLFAGDSPSNCNSYWAQGGIIYRNFDEKSGDSAEALSQDIHTAGAGLCQHDAVAKVATEGPSIVEQLLLDSSGIFADVPFDRCHKTNELLLCLGMLVSVMYGVQLYLVLDVYSHCIHSDPANVLQKLHTRPLAFCTTRTPPEESLRKRLLEHV